MLATEILQTRRAVVCYKANGSKAGSTQKEASRRSKNPDTHARKTHHAQKTIKPGELLCENIYLLFTLEYICTVHLHAGNGCVNFAGWTVLVHRGFSDITIEDLERRDQPSVSTRA